MVTDNSNSNAPYRGYISQVMESEEIFIHQVEDLRQNMVNIAEESLRRREVYAAALRQIQNFEQAELQRIQEFHEGNTSNINTQDSVVSVFEEEDKDRILLSDLTIDNMVEDFKSNQSCGPLTSTPARCQNKDAQDNSGSPKNFKNPNDSCLDIIQPENTESDPSQRQSDQPPNPSSSTISLTESEHFLGDIPTNTDPSQNQSDQPPNTVSTTSSAKNSQNYFSDSQQKNTATDPSQSQSDQPSNTSGSSRNVNNSGNSFWDIPTNTDPSQNQSDQPPIKSPRNCNCVIVSCPYCGRANMICLCIPSQNQAFNNLTNSVRFTNSRHDRDQSSSTVYAKTVTMGHWPT